MTARELFEGFKPGRRIATGGYFSQQPLPLEEGDTVGVVMLSLGGPASVDDVEAFLYQKLMDPSSARVPLPLPVRQRLSRIGARRQTAGLRERYKQIGGSSPLNRHTAEQARALERRLTDRFGALTRARFCTYVVTRYDDLGIAQALAQMQEDHVNKVVLLPLYPQYAGVTTGSMLEYWKGQEARGGVPSWPTTLVYEYATHPKLVQSLSERIDEGLQRFPATVRDRVPLVFSAQATLASERSRRNDPYCCLVHSTVQQVMACREEDVADRPFHVSFQHNSRGVRRSSKMLKPTTRHTLEQLSEEGHTAALIVPVAFISDRIETAYTLDIEVREEAHGLGYEYYEVTSALNCHPLLVETLAECVGAQVFSKVSARGDGADALPGAIPDLPRYPVSSRTVRCRQCSYVCEAHDWRGQAAVHVPVPHPGKVTPSRAA